MNWEITWGSNDPPIFGFDFAAMLVEGIEEGIEELLYLQLYGETCELCGEFRHCNTHIGESVTPTDRGPMREEEEKIVCEECWDRLTSN